MEWLMTLAPAAPSPVRRRGPAFPGNIEATGGRGALDTEVATTDEALVAQVAAGDQRAFAAIVRRHGGRLRALALRFSGGAAEADDIVQETFWSLWRNAGRWRPGGPPFAAYLTRMAINRAIDGERKLKTRRFFGLEAADDAPDPAPPADDKLAASNALAAVAADIKALPARQRAAILLAADGERTNGEIAEAMGLSIGAVEQLLVRARRTLRARLADREHQGGLDNEP
jgi:RNA polymerase sigma-70 factor (ECF subfamily)